MIYISEGLLYICFALLTGALLLRLIPEHYRPTIVVPSGLLLALCFFIPFLSFIPIHYQARLFAEQFDLSYWDMLKSLLLDVKSGINRSLLKNWMPSRIASPSDPINVQVQLLPDFTSVREA